MRRWHCPDCGADVSYVDDVCPLCGFEFPYDDYTDDDDTEPNPLAWLEELDEDDPLRTGESEWERGLRTGDST